MLQRQSEGISLTAHDLYLREVRWIPQLTDEEEAGLLECLAGGGDTQQASERLTEGYQPLVLALAKRLVRHCQQMELLDLVQEGNMGLLHAIRAYNSRKSTASFRTLAFAWIRGAMLMAIWRNERFIHLPFDKVRALRQMNTVNTSLVLELGREPTAAETARAMGVKENDVLELLLLQEQQVISLQTLSVDGEDDLSIEDMFPDPTTSVPAYDRFSSLDAALESLPERERLIIKLRYGFEDGQPYSQKEVASLLGLALSTVAALDRRAQSRLRKMLATA